MTAKLHDLYCLAILVSKAATGRFTVYELWIWQLTNQNIPPARYKRDPCFVLPARIMEAKMLRNKREQLRRGKKTLFNKAHKLAKVHEIDIAIIMCKNGQTRNLGHRLWSRL